MTAGLSMDRHGPDRVLVDAATALLAQPAEMGALPTLMGATAPQLRGGEYVGPSRGLGMRGLPRTMRASTVAYDATLAARLWTLSEQATGICFPCAPMASA
jgi:protochlorophyllide reductase